LQKLNKKKGKKKYQTLSSAPNLVPNRTFRTA